jgi:hypothetical protein
MNENKKMRIMLTIALILIMISVNAPILVLQKSAAIPYKVCVININNPSPRSTSGVPVLVPPVNIDRICTDLRDYNGTLVDLEKMSFAACLKAVGSLAILPGEPGFVCNNLHPPE